jgi:adenosylcobinamide-phosphate synthase
MVRPRSPGAAGSVALGLLVDRLVVEPPTPLHPVAWFGRLMGGVERTTYRSTRGAGAGYTAVGVAIGAVAGSMLRSSFAATMLAVAGGELRDVARDVASALDAGDVEGARSRLPALVGRDTAGLGANDMARAVVESVAENTVDAVVAPALWAAVGGAPAVLAYRAVNTLDAMVGYRSSRYAEFGWASARLDDAAAWVPARVTAGLVAAVRPGRAAAVLRAVSDDAKAHPSPNAGVAEAAFAAGLGVRLGGPATYRGVSDSRPYLGRGPSPEPGDIERAVTLSRDVTLALAGALVAWAGLRARHRLGTRRGVANPSSDLVGGSPQ